MNWILVNVSYSSNVMCTEARYDGNVTRSSEVTQEALFGRYDQT